MKKILFVLIFFFLFIIKIEALDIKQENIYFYDKGLYAYLSLENTGDEDLFIEYFITDGTNEKTLDLIEVKEGNQKIPLLTLEDELLGDLTLLEVKSRLATKDTDYTYMDWTKEQSVILFDFKDIPVPEITNFKIGTSIMYEITNQGEIENFFKNYSKVYETSIVYREEYRINDGEWTLDHDNIDLEDVKVDFRVSYKVGNFESKSSNVLTYEKHPEASMCIFGSDICCNQFFNISICIWLLGLFIVLIVTLILIDNKRRLVKEA